MTKVRGLGEARAARSGDCRDWSVKEMLQSALADIEDGTRNPSMAVLFMRIEPSADTGGKVRYSYLSAGGTTMELTGLATYCLHAHLLTEDNE